jgi:hypothetical protein
VGEQSLLIRERTKMQQQTNNEKETTTMKYKINALITALGLSLSALGNAQAQGTAFTYQGRLTDGGNPANGNYSLRFTLYDASANGNVAGGPITNAPVAVANGLFTVSLDFGAGVFAGSTYWLQIDAATNSASPSYASLAPRQQLTPTPYAIYAESAASASVAYNVADNTINTTSFNTAGGSPTPGSVLGLNSGGALQWLAPSGGGGGSGWSLTGNRSTTASNFLGTLDSQPLELWVNSMRAFRLEPGGGDPNVVGGLGSSVDPSSGFAAIGGGNQNTIGASVFSATIGGGQLNRVNGGGWGTIGGGYLNTVSNAQEGTVSGGAYNTANHNAATVAGGYINSATGVAATVGGGNQNVASGAGSFVGGGGYDGTNSLGNLAAGQASTVAGGIENLGLGDYSGVLGGFNNVASGPYSMAVGGSYNVASGLGSFAAGHQAHAAHDGSFVWADALGGAFSSTAPDQFNVRAYGGVRFVTGGAGLTIDGVLVTNGGGGGGISGWSLAGNNGTDPSVNFLGTKDDVGLEFHVFSLRGLRLDHTFDTLWESINVNGGYWGNTIAQGVTGATIAGGGDVFHISNQQAAEPNRVTGSFGTVAGGHANTAGYEATVPGGANNSATGNGSFAAGRKAQTSYDGNFVWSDGSATFNGFGADSFDVLATGEVGFYSGPGFTKMRIQANGFVGINENTPTQQLEVNGKFLLVDGLGDEQAYLGGDGAGHDVQIGSLNPLVSAVTCYNAANNSYMQFNCGSVYASGNMSACSVTIRGGCDLAEPFAMADNQVPQGSVVVIDDENPGRLKMSDGPYDTRVAGIVSGANGINPGISLHQEGTLEGGQNVALSGRVYVHADAAYGSIRPGDLLTTSATAGHAMKVSDHAKAQGAILGKAMTGLKDGKGMVLVLVTLQ